jgi:hypothetical protein
VRVYTLHMAHQVCDPRDRVYTFVQRDGSLRSAETPAARNPVPEYRKSKCQRDQCHR